jgi:methylenetetrahydrofolate reductase (NADPH)
VPPLTAAAREALAAALRAARFEVIPLGGVEARAGHLPRGTKVTVTCSPARGIEATLRHAELLAQGGLRVVPHISARLVRDTAHLRDILQRVDALGVRDLFVIGGDAKAAVGAFDSALALLRAMAELGHACEEIGVAAYPEQHPLIDEAALRRALAAKQRYATYMVTQICFDAQTITRWLAQMRGQGIVLPAYVGLPGVVEAAHLLRISLKIGVGTSLRFLSRNAGMATALLRGNYRPTALLDDLAPSFGDAALGLRGLHINTFNRVENALRWRQEMLDHLDILLYSVQ